MKKFFEGLIKQTWFKLLLIVIVVVAGVLLYYKFGNKTVGETPQEILIESKGLAEFNPENNTINTFSAQDKKIGEEMMPILKSMDDGKDNNKNNAAIKSLGKIIEKYPDYSDAYVLRATISIIVGDSDYQKILADVDNAIKFHSSKKYTSSYDSTAGMYALRTKVDILSGDYQQAMNDLETAVKDNPDKINSVFNTGEIKPDTESKDATALQEKDLDLLVGKYPNDYRSYMFRGLFYNEFSFYDNQYYKPAVENLKKAISINPDSYLANYFLGTVYQKAATFIYSFTMSGGTSAYDAARDTMNTDALQYFKEAAKDLLFEQAQFQVAESLYSLKMYSDAIPYFDTAIVDNPNDAGAYTDRGTAKQYINNYFGAVDDFSKAIEIKKSKPDSSAVDLATMYQYRADAYVKNTNYPNAIDDYSRAIGLKFGSMTIQLGTPQIKNIYPELKDIPDKDLIEGLRQKYYSSISSNDFYDSTIKNGEKKPYQEFILGDLYTSRGDTYLLAENFKNAAKDYARATIMGSTSILDRWRLLSKNSGTEYYIDAQTMDFSQGNTISLWVKILNTNDQSYFKSNFQLNCSEKQIKSLSATNYDFLGNTTGSIPAQGWESIVPETIGEILYNGSCK